MSNLNNVFGNSNSCPAIMSDGRGANTNFKPRNDYFQDIKNKVGATTSLELRQNLKLNDVKQQTTSEFLCSSDPHGNVNVSQDIGNSLLTAGGSWRDNFTNLKN